MFRIIFICMSRPVFVHQLHYWKVHWVILLLTDIFSPLHNLTQNTLSTDFCSTALETTLHYTQHMIQHSSAQITSRSTVDHFTMQFSGYLKELVSHMLSNLHCTLDCSPCALDGLIIICVANEGSILWLLSSMIGNCFLFCVCIWQFDSLMHTSQRYHQCHKNACISWPFTSHSSWQLGY